MVRSRSAGSLQPLGPRGSGPNNVAMVGIDTFGPVSGGGMAGWVVFVSGLRPVQRLEVVGLEWLVDWLSFWVVKGWISS